MPYHFWEKSACRLAIGSYTKSVAVFNKLSTCSCTITSKMVAPAMLGVHNLSMWHASIVTSGV